MTDFGFYFSIGWEHIMNREALDHIFFIAALAAIYLPSDWKSVLLLVTAFTIGHAITLLLSAKNIIEVNESWVEFLIPCTIVITAISNLLIRNFTRRSIRLNYALALFFGLIHGLAFASTLKWLLAGDQDFITAWIGFSLGLELGQILIVAVILVLAGLFVSRLRLNRRIWIAIISVPVAIFAIVMAVDRWPLENKKERASIEHFRDTTTGRHQYPVITFIKT